MRFGRVVRCRLETINGDDKAIKPRLDQATPELVIFLDRECARDYRADSLRVGVANEIEKLRVQERLSDIVQAHFEQVGCGASSTSFTKSANGYIAPDFVA